MTSTTEKRYKVVWANGTPAPSAPQKPESEIAYTEGLWKDLTGMSWMFTDGNPACLVYAMRAGFAGLPTDDNVHYVHIGALGYLVHETELVEL